MLGIKRKTEKEESGLLESISSVRIYLYKKCRVLASVGSVCRVGAKILYPTVSTDIGEGAILSFTASRRLLSSLPRLYRLTEKKYGEYLSRIASFDGIGIGTPRLNVDFSAALSNSADKLIINREIVLTYGKERRVLRTKDVFSLSYGYLIG